MAIDLRNIPGKSIRPMSSIEDQIRQVTCPEGTQWFEVGGHVMFPRYGVSGGLEFVGMSVLFNTDAPPFAGVDMGRHGLNGWDGREWYTVEFGCYDTWHEVNAKFKAAFLALRPHLYGG